MGLCSLMDYTTTLQFDDEQLAVFNSIKRSMSSTGRTAATRKFGSSADDLRGNWEAYYLLEFATSIRPQDDDGKKILDDLLDKKGIHGGFVYIQNSPSRSGFSPQKSNIIFQCLSEYRNVPLLVCFLDFLKFCKTEGYSFSPFVDKNGKVIDISLEELIENTEKHIISHAPRPCSNVQTGKTNCFFDPFESKIKQLQKHSVYERKEVLSAIKCFVEKHDRGFITIEGGAGFGKSSILACAISLFDHEEVMCVWHFNSITRGANTTPDLIESIFTQLSEKHEKDCSIFQNRYELIKNTGQNYDNFLECLFDHISKILCAKEIRLVIVIDALDEICSTDKTASGIWKGNLQSIPETLPQHIYVLISSRSFRNQSYKSNHFILDLSSTEENSFQRRDIEGYIHLKLQDSHIKKWIIQQEFAEGIPSEAELTRIFCEQSQYAFIYLFHVFNDISNYTLGDLPKGIEGYFNEQYRRLDDEYSHQAIEKKLILACISNFKPVVSCEITSAFSNLSDVLQINMLIKSWLLTQLVQIEVEESHSYLKFFHLSFYEFLNDYAHESAQDLRPYKESKAAFSRVADYLSEKIQYCDDRFAFKSRMTSREKNEFFNVILDVLYKSERMSELAILLTNKEFCNYFISSFLIEPKERIVRQFMKLFKYFEDRKDSVIANRNIEDFFIKIAPKKDPIISRKLVLQLIQGQKSTFEIAFNEFKRKEMDQKLKQLKDT